MSALKVARAALLGSVVGYAAALVLGVTGCIGAGIGMLAAIGFTFAMALSAVACVITQLLSSSRQRNRLG